MTSMELDALAAGVAPVLKDLMSPLLARIAELEQRMATFKGEPGPRGERGEPGIAGPQGTVGDRGDPGEPGPPGIVGPMGPPGIQGDRGETGIQGTTGDRGDTGATGEKGESIIGPMGLTGPEGARGEKGPTGDRGEIGLQGKDGVGLAAAVLGQNGELILTCSDGSIKTLGVVVGKDGAPGERGADGVKGIDGINGKDGQDALGFDDIDVQHDGERSFTFKFVRGDVVKTFGAFTVPLVIDRGVYQAGTVYEKGDGVTWAGSYWIAQESTTAKPGEAGMQSRAWRLAVKKGGDGKVGAKGDPGDRGPKGDQGPMGPARY